MIPTANTLTRQLVPTSDSGSKPKPLPGLYQCGHLTCMHKSPSTSIQHVMRNVFRRLVRFWPKSRIAAFIHCWLNHFSTTPLTPNLMHVRKLWTNIFQGNNEIPEIMRKRDLISSVLSLFLSISLDLAPVNADLSCSCIGLKKAFVSLNLLFTYCIFNVCFEWTLCFH